MEKVTKGMLVLFFSEKARDGIEKERTKERKRERERKMEDRWRKITALHWRSTISEIVRND